MNNRVSELKIRRCFNNYEPKHKWYRVFFMVDNEVHWIIYDKPDELAVYAAFKEFINNCYPERES